MEIGKRLVGHEKQLHEKTIPSRGSQRVLPQVSAKKCVQISSKKCADVSVSTISRRLSKKFELKSGKPAKNKADTPNKMEEAGV